MRNGTQNGFSLSKPQRVPAAVAVHVVALVSKWSRDARKGGVCDVKVLPPEPHSLRFVDIQPVHAQVLRDQRIGVFDLIVYTQAATTQPCVHHVHVTATVLVGTL